MLPTLEDAIAQPFADQDKCSPSLTETDRLRADADHLLSLIHDQTKDFAEVLAVVGRINARVERLEGMIPKSVSVTSAVEQENKGNGMRTERVTLELTGRFDSPPSEWPWEAIFSHDCRVHIEPGDNVRVVDEVAIDAAWAERLADERDAAIRERDELRTECERLRGKVAAMEGQSCMDIEREIDVEEAWESCDIRQHWPDDEPGTSHRYAESMRLEIVRLRARVAELESNANAATILAKIREAEWNVASELAAEANAELSAAPAASVAAGTATWFAAVGKFGMESVCMAFNSFKECEKFAHGEVRVIPLYRSPPPAPGWLTEEERSLLSSLADHWKSRAAELERPGTWGSGLPNPKSLRLEAAMLTAILARSTPPEVVLPPEGFVVYEGETPIDARDRQWIAALAAAGVTCKEVGE